jgi:hypothetical protein
LVDRDVLEDDISAKPQVYNTITEEDMAQWKRGYDAVQPCVMHEEEGSDGGRW